MVGYCHNLKILTEFFGPRILKMEEKEDGEQLQDKQEECYDENSNNGDAEESNRFYLMQQSLVEQQSRIAQQSLVEQQRRIVQQNLVEQQNRSVRVTCVVIIYLELNVWESTRLSDKFDVKIL